MVGYNCFIIFQYYFMNYYLTIYHSKILKILSKQVNLCLYRGISANPILRKISDSWYTNFENFIILKIVENFEFFWNFMTPLPMVYRTHDILILPTHGILTPLPMVFWHPYPWYIELLPWYFDTPTMCRGSIYHGWGCQNIMGRGVKISGVGGVKIPLPMVFWPPTHGILTLLPMVYRTSIHGILTPIPMVFWPPLSWRG
jgi:hypothetical protein